MATEEGEEFSHMDAGEILLLFCAQAAAGILWILPLVSMEQVGRSFYQINVRVAVCLLLIGHAFKTRFVGWEGLAFVLAMGGAFIGFYYSLRLKRKDFRESWPWFVVTWVCATASLVIMIIQSMFAVAQQLNLLWTILALPCILAGALLQGSATLSMVLGHYYLNYPKLSILPLKKYNAALILASVFRALLFGVGLAIIWQLNIGTTDPERGFFMEHALILTQRTLFGIVGPCLLAVMSWQTVKIHSTQSATGILYANMVLVAIGELTASWFLVTAGLSL